MSEFQPTVRVHDDTAPAPAAPVPAPTPTAQVVADANRIVFVTDAVGRKIGVRRMSMSIRRRTLKTISAQSQEKPGYMNLAYLAACVTSINGVPHDATFGTEAIFDSIIDLLDDHGCVAVAQAVADNFSVDDDAKKSPPTTTE